MPKVSKKAAKSKTAPERKPKRKGRGGRKPGVWTQVKPEQIVAYRKAQRLSRASLARALGVSSTTIQNWETGKSAATAKAQARLAEAMSGNPRQLAPKAGDAPKNGAAGSDMVIDATARIVTAFLSSAKIKREDLRGVIQEVRSALQ
jgi:DNA-binding transcriptional regulator YiaG